MAQANPERVDGKEAVTPFSEQMIVYKERAINYVRQPSGGGVNWLTQKEVDRMQKELDDSIARDAFWLRILFGLVIIGVIYALYDAVIF